MTRLDGLPWGLSFDLPGLDAPLAIEASFAHASGILQLIVANGGAQPATVPDLV